MRAKKLELSSKKLTPRLFLVKSKSIISKETTLREFLKLRSIGLVKQKGIGRGTYYIIK